MTTCYNPSKNVVFIHVHKCAGTAITKAFTGGAKNQDSGWILPREADDQKTKEIMNQNNQVLESQFSAPEHFRAIDMQHYLGEDVFESYFKFAVSRNPWERLASWYFFLRNSPNKGQSTVARNLTMEDFIKYSVDHFYLPQYQWVTNAKGKIIVDEIIKLENLSDSWPSISDRVSDEPIALRTVNASPNTTDPRPNPFGNVRKKTLELFRDAYAQDFELLGYDKSLPESRDENKMSYALDEIWTAEVEGTRDVSALCKEKGISEDVYALHREACSTHYYMNNVSSLSGDRKNILKENQELRAKFKDDFFSMQAKIKDLNGRNQAVLTEKSAALKKSAELRVKFKDDFTAIQAKNKDLSDRNKLLSAEKSKAMKKSEELRAKFKDDFAGLQAKIRNLSDRNTEISTRYKELQAKQTNK